ncbi:hypothetical protein [Halochromatium roseum]|uniref:hypothetical protein n=1 Tax=Halochromatium roseum TaxID=391920 RepID=UPI001913F1F9|nr:hypothetical protein [Halochromatium roseum]MBK5939392.1 hypothetical protein [Halochromatium roseum]
MTDLNAVEPRLMRVAGGLAVTGVVPTPLGPIEKRWLIDEAGGRGLANRLKVALSCRSGILKG